MYMCMFVYIYKRLFYEASRDHIGNENETEVAAEFGPKLTHKLLKRVVLGF